MVRCEECTKEFRYPWMLRRHLAGKKGCKMTENDSQMTENDTEVTANDTGVTENDTSIRCKYCKKGFKRKYNKDQHEDVCKEHDEIWDLEKECKVEHKVQQNELECKFCNKIFSRNGSLTRHNGVCEERRKYKKELEGMLEEKKENGKTINNNVKIQNANTINDNTNVIFVLGEESIKHVDTEKVVKMIMEVKSKLRDENVYMISGQTVVDFHKMIREDERNRNVVVPNERRQIAYVRRDGGFVKEEVSEVMDESFKNTSEKLYRTMETIEEDMDGFNSAKTRNIHVCVGSFSKRGFKGHGPLPVNMVKYNHRREDVQRIKRRFKVANVVSL